jgi:hypothetical protein
VLFQRPNDHRRRLVVVTATRNRRTSKLAQLKLLEIKACDGKVTSNRNSNVRVRPQRTGELGADPDTVRAALEVPWRLFFFLLSPRQQADMPRSSIDFLGSPADGSKAADKLPAQYGNRLQTIQPTA